MSNVLVGTVIINIVKRVGPKPFEEKKNEEKSIIQPFAAAAVEPRAFWLPNVTITEFLDVSSRRPGRKRRGSRAAVVRGVRPGF